MNLAHQKNKFEATFLMNFFKTTVFAALSFASALFAQETSQTKSPALGASALQQDLYKVFQKNKDCVVKIYSQRNIHIKSENGASLRKTLGVGSGFITGIDGTVVTSAYATYAAEKIWVEWKGKLMDAECVGFDPLTTLAVLKVAGGFQTKQVRATYLNANAPLAEPATMLMLISYELGLPPAPRTGLLTAHNIEFGGVLLPTVYMRTNILSPRGSLGAPVFDLNGNFVGMQVASLPEIGGSFILPAKAVAKIRDDILLCGKPIYSWFGLRAEDSAENGKRRVKVTTTIENAPASKAGFKKGDYITEFNSKKVSDNTMLRNETFFVRPGETVSFKIERAGKFLELKMVADKLDAGILRAAESVLSPKRTSEETKQKETPR